MLGEDDFVLSFFFFRKFRFCFILNFFFYVYYFYIFYFFSGYCVLVVNFFRKKLKKKKLKCLFFFFFKYGFLFNFFKKPQFMFLDRKHLMFFSLKRKNKRVNFKKYKYNVKNYNFFFFSKLNNYNFFYFYNYFNTGIFISYFYEIYTYTFNVFFFFKYFFFFLKYNKNTNYRFQTVFSKNLNMIKNSLDSFLYTFLKYKSDLDVSCDSGGVVRSKVEFKLKRFSVLDVKRKSFNYFIFFFKNLDKLLRGSLLKNNINFFFKKRFKFNFTKINYSLDILKYLKRFYKVFLKVNTLSRFNIILFFNRYLFIFKNKKKIEKCKNKFFEKRGLTVDEHIGGSVFFQKEDFFEKSGDYLFNQFRKNRSLFFMREFNYFLLTHNFLRVNTEDAKSSAVFFIKVLKKKTWFFSNKPQYYEMLYELLASDFLQDSGDYLNFQALREVKLKNLYSMKFSLEASHMTTVFSILCYRNLFNLLRDRRLFFSHRAGWAFTKIKRFKRKFIKLIKKKYKWPNFLNIYSLLGFLMLNRFSGNFGGLGDCFSFVNGFFFFFKQRCGVNLCSYRFVNFPLYGLDYGDSEECLFGSESSLFIFNYTFFLKRFEHFIKKNKVLSYEGFFFRNTQDLKTSMLNSFFGKTDYSSSFEIDFCLRLFVFLPYKTVRLHYFFFFYSYDFFEKLNKWRLKI